MSLDDLSTLKLGSTGRHEAAAQAMVVRWLSPCAPSTYSVLEGARIGIGRGVEAHVRLDTASVSRAHAELYRQGPIYAVRDLDSTNGSFVNGARVQHAAIADGDVVRFGDVLGVVMRVGRELIGQGSDVSEVVPGILFGPGLREQLKELERASPSELPVAIHGETGVGKEGIARAVHHLSGRRGAFHAVNCSALPVALAEAELFGHRKGAFTGAEQSGLGHLRAADHGTLFLDELADLPLPVQAKLLRALQDGMVTPLGETRSVPVDVRIVAAGQKPLSQLVSEKVLREDLAYRLNGIEVEVLPLRKRRCDVGVLFEYFLRRHGSGKAPEVGFKVMERLLLHDWPGNVRELEFLARKLLVLHGHEPVFKTSMLPEPMQGEQVPDVGASAPPTASRPTNRRDHDLERLAVELRNHDGNLARAASAAGISRQRAYRLLDGRSVDELLAQFGSDAAAQDGAFKIQR